MEFLVAGSVGNAQAIGKRTPWRSLVVMRGLDPRIDLPRLSSSCPDLIRAFILLRKSLAKGMDHRVKPGDDASVCDCRVKPGNDDLIYRKLSSLNSGAR
jgi:hypothetical protein